MTTEWIESYLSLIDSLQKGLDSLIDNYVVFRDAAEEQAVLDIIIKSRQAVSVWTQALPLDEVLWASIEHLPPFDYVVRPLSDMSVAIRDLPYIRALASPIDDSLSPLLDALYDDAIGALTLLANVEDALYKPRIDRVRPRFPRAIVGELCLHHYPKQMCQPFSAFNVADWPPVPYHYDIDALLRRLIFRLFMDHGERPVNLSVKRTSAYFEIALTRLALHLRPETWEGLIERGVQDNVECLHELKGEIEPLTWDEGQGEGVIVRLRWA